MPVADAGVPYNVINVVVLACMATTTMLMAMMLMKIGLGRLLQKPG